VPLKMLAVRHTNPNYPSPILDKIHVAEPAAGQAQGLSDATMQPIDRITSRENYQYAEGRWNK
jgi:hypothetical protein